MTIFNQQEDYHQFLDAIMMVSHCIGQQISPVWLDLAYLFVWPYHANPHRYSFFCYSDAQDL